ncbi:MAG: choice-of-anchor E domain-containing protein [Phycisphaeraceae bacterium]|nr:choice-of-anchor E domain-containing protein [Phycisphaeraceae bacterium]
MWNRKSLLAGKAAVAMVCLGATMSALALTEGPFDDMFAERTNWGPIELGNMTDTAVAIPQFDDMGGTRTLMKVTIDWNAGVAGSIQVESLDNSPSMITATLSANITIMGPSGFSENPMPAAVRMFDATAFDGMPDFGGTSGITFPNVAANVAGSTMFTQMADLNNFIGNGNVVFTAQATATSTATGPGNVSQLFLTDASVSVSVTYEFDGGEIVCDPGCKEPNDYCDPQNLEGSCYVWDYLQCGKYIDDKLEKRIEQGCEPDTYMVLFNKQNQIVNSDDNGSAKGNGWASGLYDVDGSNGIIDNGDGTYTLRVGVTGRPDGLDGVFNGLFQNGPHGQLGKFKLYVQFLDEKGDPLVNPILPNGGGISPNPVCYVDEFNSGAEAFHINYTLPFGTESVNVWIDNMIPCEELRNDVDFFCIDNLVPLCDYCITQIGGLDCECIPTATAIGWFDKSCTLIFKEQGNQPTPGYTQLCAVADANGRILIAVSGANDCDFNGLDDSLQDLGTARAPVECPEPTPGHGVAGCYTLCIEVTGAHSNNDTGGGTSGDVTVMQEALDHGDLNMDGVTNTSDLGILIGSFGWVAGQ